MRKPPHTPARGNRAARLLAAAAAFVAPLVTFAAEHAAEAAEHGGGGGWSPFQGDFGNFLWTLITLIVVYLVLKRFAWKPLLDALQSREKFIEDSLRQATEARDRAEAQLREYEAKLAAARDEVEAMLDEGRRDAAALREREHDKGRQEARQELERAKREIHVATDTAIRDLYERAAELSTSAAAKILDRELSPKDHERLVAEAIEALGKPAGDAPAAS
jgi:F-type H+-transporting ATPase subunit b